MLQPNHRGIYEYLWSEHKYVALSVSIKAFQTTAGKLGKINQSLTMLRRLLHHSLSEKPEHLTALLNAYMHIKRRLSRSEREAIIETLLVDEKQGSQMIFSQAIELKESTLYGCRLFYPVERAIYKFWDAQDNPGLWMCFGPFQLHLSPDMVFWRIIRSGIVSREKLLQTILLLKNGISIEEYYSWDSDLRIILENNNLVALPGTTVQLHPRVDFDFASMVEPDMKVDIYHMAALITEKIWDESCLGNENIAQLPDYEVFKMKFNAENLPEFIWDKEFSLDEAYDFLANVFFEQRLKESGKKTDQSESDSGIGMEACDEHVDSEEGEHGYDEPED